MRFLWTRGKNDIALFLVLSLAGLFTIGAGTYLGNVYLHLLQVPDDTSPVFGPVRLIDSTPPLTAGLPPVRVYYVQTGVYTLKDTAIDAQTALENMGFVVSVTGEGPYKVVAGVFSTRQAAAGLASVLAKHKTNSYIHTLVLNETALEYNAGQKKTVENILPVLKLYSRYIEEAVSLSEYPFPKDYKEKFRLSLQELADTYSSIEAHEKSLPSQARAVIKEDLFNIISDYQTVAENLPGQWDSQNYYSLHVSLTEVVEDYGRLVNSLKMAVKEPPG